MCKQFLLIICFCIVFTTWSKTNHTVGQWLNVLNTSIDKFWDADVGTFKNEIDSNSNYFKTICEEQDLVLCEAKVIQITKHESLLLIQGTESDEQCVHFHHFCFQGNPLNNQINEFNLQNYFSLELDLILKYLVKTETQTIIDKYLPEIKSNYLGEDATMTQVLNEFYDLKLEFNPDKSKFMITLKYCDYIPLNAVDIDVYDQEKIANGYYKMQLYFDVKKKKFSF